MRVSRVLCVIGMNIVALNAFDHLRFDSKCLLVKEVLDDMLIRFIGFQVVAFFLQPFDDRRQSDGSLAAVVKQDDDVVIAGFCCFYHTILDIFDDLSRLFVAISPVVGVDVPIPHFKSVRNEGLSHVLCDVRNAAVRDAHEVC